MRTLAYRTLVALISVLTAGIAVMWITGGGVLRLPGASLEFAGLELWVMALLALVGVALRIDPGAGGEARLGLFGRAWRGALFIFGSPERSRRWAIRLIAGVGGALFVAHVFKHWSLLTSGWDVSFVHQPLFYPWGHDNVLHSAMSPAGNALGGHLHFTFFLIAPLTWLIKSDELIFAIQAALTFGPLLYAFTRGPLRHVAPQAAFFAAIITVAHLGLRNSMVFDFREDAIAYAGLLGMAFCLLEGRWAGYFASLALAMLSKENVFAVTLSFAGPILLSRRIPASRATRWALASATAAISVAYGAIAFKILIPLFAQKATGAHPIFARFAEFGSTPAEIAVTILTTPSAWLALTLKIFSKATIKYLILLFGPYAFFFRTREAWVWLIVALPGVLMNIVHGYRPQVSMIFHYELLILPGLLMACWEGMRSVPSARPRAWLWATLLALAFSGKWPGYYLREYFPHGQRLDAAAFLNAVPREASLAIGPRLSAQVNHVRELRILRALPGRPSIEELAMGAETVVLEARSPETLALERELIASGARVEREWPELEIRVLRR